MRKALVVITVAFIFLCGIIGKNSADRPLFKKTTACIENIEKHAYQTTNETDKNYFISNNISSALKFALNWQNQGTFNNNIFCINNFFAKSEKSLKKYDNSKEYLLAISLFPRAP